MDSAVVAEIGSEFSRGFRVAEDALVVSFAGLPPKPLEIILKNLVSVKPTDFWSRPGAEHGLMRNFKDAKAFLQGTASYFAYQDQAASYYGFLLQSKEAGTSSSLSKCLRGRLDTWKESGVYVFVSEESELGLRRFLVGTKSKEDHISAAERYASLCRGSKGLVDTCLRAVEWEEDLVRRAWPVYHRLGFIRAFYGCVKDGKRMSSVVEGGWDGA